jgi:hypothetical protein
MGKQSFPKKPHSSQRSNRSEIPASAFLTRLLRLFFCKKSNYAHDNNTATNDAKDKECFHATYFFTDIFYGYFIHATKIAFFSSRLVHKFLLAQLFSGLKKGFWRRGMKPLQIVTI